jgi:hypothetical protein
MMPGIQFIWMNNKNERDNAGLIYFPAETTAKIIYRLEKKI